MTAIRWGILATGYIAHAFTEDLRTAGLEVAAVGSRRLDAAQDFAAQYDIPRAHGSYEQLVADPDVDIVYVASPHSRHREHAILALEAGKHVLIEKAVTLDAAEAAAIRGAAAARGLLAMEAMWTRYLPHMARIRELIADGALGEVRTVFADHTQSLPTDPAHRLNALELGGGALLDLGIYPVSFAVDILGPVAEARATGRLGETGADTEVAIALAHESGAVSSLVTSSRGAGPNIAHIVGTDARIDIDTVWYSPTTFRLIATDGTVIEQYTSDVPGRGMQFQALYAEQLIREGRTTSDLLPFDESVAIMGTLDDIRAQLGVVYPTSPRRADVPDLQNARVAVYLDFDNIVMSWYDRVHGRNAYAGDRQKIIADPDEPEIAQKLKDATIDVGAIIDYAASFGTLVLTRAYADWSSPVNAFYRSQLVARAVDLVQLFPAAAYAKNGADIRLAVDTVEDMFRLPDLTHVVIVAGDSDYVPLAQRCKRLGRVVVGVGVAGSTAKSLAAACDQFDSYDSLPGVIAPTPPSQKKADAAAPATSSGSRRRKKVEEDPVAELLRRALILERERTDDEWVHLSAVKNLLKRMDPSFSEKALGHRSFSDFVGAYPAVADIDETTNIVRVRLHSAEAPAAPASA